MRIEFSEAWEGFEDTHANFGQFRRKTAMEFVFSRERGMCFLCFFVLMLVVAMFIVLFVLFVRVFIVLFVPVVFMVMSVRELIGSSLPGFERAPGGVWKLEYRRPVLQRFQGFLNCMRFFR